MRAESKGVGCRQRRLEVGARLAQRTANIQPVSVTLDVLKNSGWLNARACCQKKHAKVKYRPQDCVTKKQIVLASKIDQCLSDFDGFCLIGFP